MSTEAVARAAGGALSGGGAVRSTGPMAAVVNRKLEAGLPALAPLLTWALSGPMLYPHSLRSVVTLC